MINNVSILPTDRLVFDLEMLQIDNNEQKKKTLKQEISSKYGVPLKNIEINFKPITVDKNGNKISLTDEITTNLQKPEFQQKLMKELIEIQKIEDVNLDEIYDIDNTINSFVDFNSYSKHKEYKFKYVKWDNYLSYGKGNFFDFSKLNGLVLLNGFPENQCGKTTFAIDLLRFALFGKADKSPTLDSVFNIYLQDETEVKVEVCIEIDSIDYVIRRTITRPSLNKRTSKSKPKQKVEYFKLINGEYELIENCEAESNTQTNNIIRETVGSVDDFNLVISATAYTLGDLLRMGQTDKGKLFSKWLGLVTLEDKDKITKDYYKTNVLPKLLSNKYDKKTLSNEIEDYKTVIMGNTKKISELELKEKEIEILIQKKNTDKITTLSKKKEIKENITFNIKTVESNLSVFEDELKIKRSQMSQMKEEYAVLKDVSFDNQCYLDKRNQLSQLQSRNGELKGLITSQKNEINRINRLKEEKICPNCGHTIDINEQDTFINDINVKINEYINEGVINKTNIDNIQNEILALEKNKSDLEKLNNLKLKMSAVKVTIDNIKLKIEDCKRKLTEFEENKENILINNEIDKDIRVIDEQIKTETFLKEQTIREIQTLKSEIKTYDEEINKRNVIIKKLTEEERLIRNWNIYQQLVGKNGIIKLVLKRSLPIINNEIEHLLSGLCDFDVILSISDDNKVCLDLIRDGKKLDLSTCASGFEATISSLALRCALGNIANIAKPNLIVLDEVLSGISSDNMENIMTLYKRVLTNYDFILHICHDTTLVDYHDSIITVTKSDNVSTIVETK